MITNVFSFWRIIVAFSSEQNKWDEGEEQKKESIDIMFFLDSGTIIFFDKQFEWNQKEYKQTKISYELIINLRKDNFKNSMTYNWVHVLFKWKAKKKTN